MDEAIRQVGLPVHCRKCEVAGFVKPGTDYGGWYKSKKYRTTNNRWFCPEHYEIGRKVDNDFFQRSPTPDPYSEEEKQKQIESTEEELYKLLD